MQQSRGTKSTQRFAMSFHFAQRTGSARSKVTSTHFSNFSNFFAARMAAQHFGFLHTCILERHMKPRPLANKSRKIDKNISNFHPSCDVLPFSQSQRDENLLRLAKLTILTPYFENTSRNCGSGDQGLPSRFCHTSYRGSKEAGGLGVCVCVDGRGFGPRYGDSTYHPPWDFLFFVCFSLL